MQTQINAIDTACKGGQAATAVGFKLFPSNGPQIAGRYAQAV